MLIPVHLCVAAVLVVVARPGSLLLALSLADSHFFAAATLPAEAPPHNRGTDPDVERVSFNESGRAQVEKKPNSVPYNVARH